MKKSERSAPRRREEWERLVQEWKVSGATAATFARTRSVSKSSLFFWSSVFKREESQKMPTRILPVQVIGAVEARPAELELAVGTVRIRFKDGASPQYVAALAKALQDMPA